MNEQRPAQNETARVNSARIADLEAEVAELKCKNLQLEEENSRQKYSQKKLETVESALGVFLAASKDADEILSSQTAESVSLDVMTGIEFNLFKI